MNATAQKQPTRAIADPVLAILSAGRCDGRRYFLPDRQLDRKEYESVNKVLSALGGKWNRRAKAHVFIADCTDVIEAAIETGQYARPDDMGWFPTPTEIARRVVDLARIEKGMRVLEPNAGEGAIALLARQAGATVACVELDPGRVQTLMKRLGDDGRITQDDFLTINPVPLYDAVLMNPPFTKRADIQHVLHAHKFLKPGGRLVAIMSAGVNFREDKLTAQFREQCASIEVLPDGAFASSGTMVRTVLVTIEA